MQGIITSYSVKGDYEIAIDGSSIKVEYDNWFSSKARTQIKDDIFTIESTTIWQNSFAVNRSDVPIGSITFNWRGNAILELNKQSFLLNAKGLLSRRFELEDKSGDLVVLLVPSVNWANFNYSYELESNISDSSDLSLMSLLFAASYAANISINNYMNS